jgi:2-keto-4-pentenoate hydratase/2-oxohepta-3-ene-1,7-dioic acid hydratase in catechol pathway
VRVYVYELAGGREVLAEDGRSWLRLGTGDLVDLLRAHGPEHLLASAEAVSGPPPAGRLVAPLHRPRKLLFCGVNYQDHVDELPPPWQATPDPFFFAKLPTAIVGPGEAIVLPRETSRVDYEVELAAVIGRTARDVDEDAVLEHVFGYTIVDDVTERAIQATDNQLTWGKGIDTFCPLGPCVALTDEIPDPQALRISTRVNGETRQDSTTANMLFPVARLLSHLSRWITLEPGDVVSTGSPAGVGYVQDPPRYLAPDDEVTVAIEGIGELTNPVVAGW